MLCQAPLHGAKLPWDGQDLGLRCAGGASQHPAAGVEDRRFSKSPVSAWSALQSAPDTLMNLIWYRYLCLFKQLDHTCIVCCI